MTLNSNGLSALNGIQERAVRAILRALARCHLLLFAVICYFALLNLPSAKQKSGIEPMPDFQLRLTLESLKTLFLLRNTVIYT